MRNIFIILILLSFCLLLSCTSDVTEIQLRKEVESTASDTLGIIYYKGRQNGFDYFRAEWNVGSKKYKLKVPNAVVKKPMDYTSDKSKWFICGPHDLNSWLP